MKQLKDYVRVYDDAIDTSLAKLLINVFENNEDSHQRFENDRRPLFTQMNLTQLYTQNKGQYDNTMISEHISEVHYHLQNRDKHHLAVSGQGCTRRVSY